MYRVRAAAYAGVRVRECAARVNLRERAAIDFALELVADCASFGVGAACPRDRFCDLGRLGGLREKLFVILKRPLAQ